MKRNDFIFPLVKKWPHPNKSGPFAQCSYYPAHLQLSTPSGHIFRWIFPLVLYWDQRLPFTVKDLYISVFKLFEFGMNWINCDPWPPQSCRRLDKWRMCKWGATPVWRFQSIYSCFLESEVMCQGALTVSCLLFWCSEIWGINFDLCGFHDQRLKWPNEVIVANVSLTSQCEFLTFLCAVFIHY